MRPDNHAGAGHDGDEIAEAQALVRYWDDLDRGTDEPPDDLDPALAATVDRLRALHAGNAPAEVRDRVWQRLQDTAPLPMDAPVVSAPPSLNGHAPGERPVSPSKNAPIVIRRRWPAANLAAAAVLLVALGLGLRALWPEHENRRVMLPAAFITTPPTPAEDMETLVSVVVPLGVPLQGAAVSFLVGRTIPPGVEMTWTTPQNLRMFAVVNGAVTIQTDGRIRVQRAGLVGVWEDFAAGAVIDLEAGDVVVLLRPASVEIGNPGLLPAEVLTWRLVAGDSTEDPTTPDLDTGDRDASEPGAISVPTTTGMMWLQRIDLAPSEGISPATDAIVHLAVAPAENAAGTPQPASSLERGDHGSLRNVGPETVTVYVVTIDPF
jgi:hypothetical protein